jgi:hypothetical protein
LRYSSWPRSATRGRTLPSPSWAPQASSGACPTRTGYQSWPQASSVAPYQSWPKASHGAVFTLLECWPQASTPYPSWPKASTSAVLPHSCWPQASSVALYQSWPKASHGAVFILLECWPQASTRPYSSWPKASTRVPKLAEGQHKCRVYPTRAGRRPAAWPSIKAGRRPATSHVAVFKLLSVTHTQAGRRPVQVPCLPHSLAEGQPRGRVILLECWPQAVSWPKASSVALKPAGQQRCVSKLLRGYDLSVLVLNGICLLFIVYLLLLLQLRDRARLVLVATSCCFNCAPVFPTIGQVFPANVLAVRLRVSTDLRSVGEQVEEQLVFRR